MRDAKRKAAYSRQRQWHDRKRTHPNRSEYQLVQAVNACGLDVVGYEYEVQDEEWCGWVNVAFLLKDRLCFVDMPISSGGRKNRKSAEHKKAYAEQQDIPFLEVKGGSVIQIRAEIEMFLLKLRRERRYNE